MIFLIFTLFENPFGIDTLLLKALILTENPQMIVNAKHRNKNGTTDYGLGQINTVWVKGLSLDTLKLLYNPHYNIYYTAYILYTKIQRYGNTWLAVGRYHSANPLYALPYSLKVRRIYEKLLKQGRNNDKKKDNILIHTPVSFDYTD